MPLDVHQLSEVLSRDDDGTSNARDALAYDARIAEEIMACAHLREEAVRLRSVGDIAGAAAAWKRVQWHLNHLNNIDAEFRQNRKHSPARFSHQEFFGEVL